MIFHNCSNHFYASMHAKNEHVINDYDLLLINVMMCNIRDNLFSCKLWQQLDELIGGF